MKGATRKIVLLLAPLWLGASSIVLAQNIRLTSITLDPEDAAGRTTNAPGAWSTNIADPLCQVGVTSEGVLLNSPGSGFDLGEISIVLKPGINRFTLYGTTLHPENLFYGAVLFFDGVQTPPQIAVFNQNGAPGHFKVQPAGTVIMGGANGGLFFDIAPGSSVHAASDGSTVEVLAFRIDSQTPGTDVVSCNMIQANGDNDTVAELILRYKPAKQKHTNTAQDAGPGHRTLLTRGPVMDPKGKNTGNP